MNWLPPRNSRVARCWALLAAVCLSLALPALAATPTIVGGNGKMLALRADGTLWKWGGDFNGGAGDSLARLRLFPEKIPGISGVTAMGIGYSHTAVLLDSGEVWTWGNNLQGQLGDGTITARSTPAKVPGLDGVVAIAVYGNSNYALKNDRTVWGWGSNYRGELAMDTLSNVTTATPITALSEVVGIVAGDGSAAALTSDGAVLTWGANEFGQLGDGSRISRRQPARITVSGVKRLIAGPRFYFAERTDGSVWAWGSNLIGQLGDGTTEDRLIPAAVSNLQGYTNIAAGFIQAAGVAPDGNVRFWGGAPIAAYRGVMFPSSSATPTVVTGAPTRPAALFIGSNSAAALAADGTIQTWSGGSGNFGPRPYPRKIANLANVAEISAGGSHSLALGRDGSVYAWGNNGNGQLGVAGSLTDATPRKLSGLKATAVVACATHSMALSDSAEVLAWGDNSYSQLGDGSAISRATPAPVNGLKGIAAIACGASHSVALGKDGQVWEWGQLWGDPANYNDTAATPRAVSGLSNIQAVAAGGYLTVALSGDGAVYAWEHGWNPSGKNDFKQQSVPTLKMKGVTRIAAGSLGAYAKSVDGRWYGWGVNYSNQFGLGNAAEMGDAAALIDTPIPTGFGPDIEAIAVNGAANLHIAAYWEQALGLSSKGEIMGLGNSLDGVLGAELLKTNTITPPARTTPLVVNNLSGIRRLVVGISHALALDANGEVWSWGDSSSGQLGEAPIDFSIPGMVLENDYATPFNLLTGRSFSASATASGGNDALTLRATLTVADADQGKPGKLYAAYQLPNGILFFLTANGWVQFDGKAIPYLSETTLGEHNFTLWPGSAAGSLAGATFYVGYGQSEADLLDNRKYQAVHTLAR